MKRSGGLPFASSRHTVRQPFRASTNTHHNTTGRHEHDGEESHSRYSSRCGVDGGLDLIARAAALNRSRQAERDELLGTVVSIDRSATQTRTFSNTNSGIRVNDETERHHSHESVRDDEARDDDDDEQQRDSGEQSRSNQQDDHDGRCVRLGDYAFATTDYIHELRSEYPTCGICSQSTGSNIANRVDPLHRNRQRHWECVLVACENCESNNQGNRESLVCVGCAVNLECRHCQQRGVIVCTYGSIELVLQRYLDVGYEYRSIAPDRAQLNKQVLKAFPQGRNETHENVVAFPFGSMLFSCIQAQKADAEQVVRVLFVEPPVGEFHCPICDCASFPTLLLLKQHEELCQQGMDDDSRRMCLMNGPCAFYLSPECISHLQDLLACHNNENAKLDVLNPTALPLQTAYFPLQRLVEVKKAQQQALTQYFLPGTLAQRRVDIRATFSDLSKRMLNSWKNERPGAFPPFLVLPFLLAAEPGNDEDDNASMD